MTRLISAAAREFEQSGFRGATTAAIARRAEVTEAQLFRYFSSKAELFRAAIFEPLNRRFADFNARQLDDPPPVERVREQARQYIAELQDFIGDNAEMLMSLLVAEAYAPDDIVSLSEVDALGEYFELGAAGMSRRVDRDRVNPELMVRVSFAAVLANVLFRDWLFPDGLAGDEQIREALIDFVIDGIGPRGDSPS
jgi:AcrR family transcriptional regulator